MAIMVRTLPYHVEATVVGISFKVLLQFVVLKQKNYGDGDLECFGGKGNEAFVPSVIFPQLNDIRLSISAE